MNPRAFPLVVACLVFHGMPFSTASLAAETAKTIKLDGKILYIPEVKLTRKTNPVTTFLHIGSWEAGRGESQNSLCTIDSRNNEIHLRFTGRLLDNSITRVITRNNADAFFDSISWGRRQATHVAFKIASAKHQPAMIEVTTDSGVALFHNGKFISSASTDNVRAAGGCGHLPIMLAPGENTINIKLSTSCEKPRVELAVSLEQSHQLAVAWQERGGFLKKTALFVRGTS